MKQRLLVERRNLDRSIVVAAISQWRCHLSACVRLTVDILSTICDGFMSTICDGFMTQCVKLMLSKFLHLWFLLFDYYVC